MPLKDLSLIELFQSFIELCWNYFIPTPISSLDITNEPSLATLLNRFIYKYLLFSYVL